MTIALAGKEVADRIAAQFPEAVVRYDDTAVFIGSEHILDVCRCLSGTPGLDFDFLVNLTGVDYTDFFEVVYHLLSLKNNHSIVLKTRCYDRDNPVLPSVTPIWRAADLQEREVFDLLGVKFEGHEDLKRIVLWDGFEGHPLRRDFL